jgi:hypothetical protein
MNAHSLASITTATLAGACSAGLIFIGGPAGAAPPSDGCARGFQLLSVQTLTDQGYHVPALVDSPTSGVLSYGRYPGNGDGWVCGVPLGNQTTSFGLPVYEFIDDQLPA